MSGAEAAGLLLLAVGELLLVICAMIDGVRRPKSAWRRAGQNKTLWVAMQPFSLVFTIGLIVPVIYFVFIRPSVRRAEMANRAEALGDSSRGVY